MFLSKGCQVSFLVNGKDGDEEILWMPEKHQMVHDPNGDIDRSCDIYVISCMNWCDGISDSDEEMRELAIKYYGSDDHLGEVDLEIPMRGWKYQCHVKAIRYRREGRLAGLYKHVYAEPQPLYFAKKSNAWKVVHPDQCVINHRGIVHP